LRTSDAGDTVKPMALMAHLHRGETLGDRVMKVDHAGEHGAVCIYLAQRWFARCGHRTWSRNSIISWLMNVGTAPGSERS
jgi:demethoxyubiquinone hydroxylase (CLK1/Coq7/Cat5 family)